ncbi:MAG: M48 family metalloprotease [Oligoflexia bacterium]|nr:M48 family metalloprotease [Oligoflexia bacterium]
MLNRVLFIGIPFFILSCASAYNQKDGGALTRAQVEYLSGRMANAIESKIPLLKHKLVNRYVNSLGQSIVAKNKDMPPLPYEFRVLKSNDFLVFSIPGGITYVSLEVLRVASLEGEFASFIAHELAHQKLGHSLIVWRRKVNANKENVNLVNFEGDFNDVFFLPKGAIYLPPEMEEEADKATPIMLYKAGFDPRMVESSYSIIKKAELAKDVRFAAYLRVHPELKSRIAWSKETTLKLPPNKNLDQSSADFRKIKVLLKSVEEAKGEGSDVGAEK